MQSPTCSPFRSSWADRHYLDCIVELCRNLGIRHPLDGLQTDDAAAEACSLEPPYLSALCLTRAENKYGLRAPDTVTDRIVLEVEMSRKRSRAAVICRQLPWLIGPFERRIAGAAEVFLHLQDDHYCLLPFVRDSHNRGLPVVNP